MDKIKKILIQKAFENKLAHFYIVEPPEKNTQNELFDWTIDLIREVRLNYGNSLSKSAIENHMDLLIIKPQENKKYVLEDFKEIYSFLSYKANTFKRKYLIINNANALTTHTSNKLLKTLEEPQIDVSIFLLNPTKAKLLDTIQSRAIKLRVSTQSEETPLEQEEIKSATIHDFVEDLKKNHQKELYVQEKIIESLIHNNPGLDTMGQIDKYFSEYNIDKLYNNTPLTRLANLYQIAESLKIF